MTTIDVRWLAALAITVVMGGAHVAQAEDAAVLATLPPELQALYVGAEQNVQPSAYDGFAMPAKPWKWCHSE